MSRTQVLLANHGPQASRPEPETPARPSLAPRAQVLTAKGWQGSRWWDRILQGRRGLDAFHPQLRRKLKIEGKRETAERQAKERSNGKMLLSLLNSSSTLAQASSCQNRG